VILTLFCCAGLAQSNRVAHSAPPIHFAPDNENEGFDEADPPSDPVLDALLRTKEAKESSEELKSFDREKLRSLFRVVQVQLGPSTEKDYLAIGSGPLTGADCYWFWIVQVQSGKANAVLFTNGLGVDILRRSTDGHRDIRGEWATAAFTGEAIYRFNGTRYVQVSKKSEAVKP